MNHRTDQPAQQTGSASPDAPKLVFGIYPGGTTGTVTGLAVGPPDDPLEIQRALAALQDQTRTFVVRGYVHYTGGAMQSAEGAAPHPPGVTQYAVDGRRLDLVLCYHDPSGNVTGWLDFVRASVNRFGPRLAKIQITEEPNFRDAPGSADGAMPNVQQALVEGVVVAQEEARRHAFNLLVGFNAVPSFRPGDEFWPGLARLTDRRFAEALDYVGLDFFPDVFRRIQPEGSSEALRKAVLGVLTRYREANLTAGQIPRSVPIHICEHGWPTGPDRSYEQQAAAIETVIRTVHEHGTNLNITHYELFALRDAASSNPDLFYQFGLMRDDYSPKPAFETYRSLIAELGA